MVKSTVKEIGEFAFFEDIPVLILFNSTAPEGLREVCVIHDFEDDPNENMLKIGSQIVFGSQVYTVEDIGHLANGSLFELGHISLYFDLGEEELLPGSVLLSPNKVPEVEAGDIIQFNY
ncbi:PTS glucitol/sorbitol transporter subunit IIA [Enterococcus sp. CWB-B31]|uniref:PTS glucitol/sorbitol transporter subunit IIA n=1 Tax=Enterococcus sp. CWB-B31 TaxID=2885159 RepID=UPI001E2A46B8|nr:PTS glucitol/sorbitol transporter subunit IIA [Enterococcus sp. CWB-B31]MCB5956114.1 PTS glucitol/sorbitol transporter subunit IIA [Enterococcus sp. CWB-B31]